MTVVFFSFQDNVLVVPEINWDFHDVISCRFRWIWLKNDVLPWGSKMADFKSIATD